MKRIVAFLAVIFLLLAFMRMPARAAGTVHYTTCDACGYCPLVDNVNSTCAIDTRPLPTGNPVPGNWQTCATCLYPYLITPGVTIKPEDCTTVKVNTNTKSAPTPMPGRQFTMIGCLTATGDVFQNTSATGASSFVQAILDLLVFRVIGGIAFLYLLYGAYIIMTSQSDPEKLNYGRRIIIGAVVGLVFSLGSVLIVNLISNGILRMPGSTPAP